MNTKSNYTDLSYLRLMADDEEEMVQTMLEMLVVELPEELEKIKSLHAAGEWEELSKICHKMKSTLAFVGNSAMMDANKELETVAKNREKLERAAGLIAVLEEQFPFVMEELRQAQA